MKEKYLNVIINSEWVDQENKNHLLFNKVTDRLKDHYKDFKTKRDLVRILGLSRPQYDLNKTLFLIRFYLIGENSQPIFMSLDEVIGNQNKNIQFDLVKIKVTKQFKTEQNNVETTSKVNSSYTHLPIRKKAYNYYIKRNTSYTGIKFRITDHIWHIPYTKDSQNKINPPYLDYNVFVTCNEIISKKVSFSNSLLERTIVKMLEML